MKRNYWSTYFRPVWPVLLLLASLFGGGCGGFHPVSPRQPSYTSGNVVRDISVTPAVLSAGGEAVIEVYFGPGEVLTRGIPNCALQPGGLRLAAGEVFAVPPALLEDSTALPSFSQLEQEAQRAEAEYLRQRDDYLNNSRLYHGYSDRDGRDPLGRSAGDWRDSSSSSAADAQRRRSAAAWPLSPALLSGGGRLVSAAPGEKICIFVLRAPEKPGVYSAQFRCPQSSGVGEKGVTERSFSFEVR